MNRTRKNLKVPVVLAGLVCTLTLFSCPQQQIITVNGVDLELKVSTSASILQVGQSLTSSISVKNIGTKVATNLKITIPVPQHSTYVSSSAGCQLASSLVTCAVASLAINTSAQVSLDLTAASAGAIVQTASVVATETEPVTSNNSSSVSVTVQNPVGTINVPPTGKVSWDWQIGAGGDSNVVAPSGSVLQIGRAHV